MTAQSNSCSSGCRATRSLGSASSPQFRCISRSATLGPASRFPRGTGVGERAGFVIVVIVAFAVFQLDYAPVPIGDSGRCP